MDSLSALPWKSKTPTPVIGKDEKLLLGSCHHWMKYVPQILVYVLLFSLCLIAFPVAISLRSASPELSLFIFFGALVAIVIVQHWFFHAMLSENVSDIMLTNKRVLLLEHRLWFADTMDEIILNRIKMVEVDKRGIVRRLLNYGDLWFDTGGGQTVPFVPSPQTWSRHIEHMMNIG